MTDLDCWVDRTALKRGRVAQGDHQLAAMLDVDAGPTATGRTITMEIPSQTMPAFWGVVGGAAAVAFVGFNFAGWVTGGAAETLASQRASKAVVAVLAPICAANFTRSKDAPAQLAELKKVKSWEQADFITKGGWAVMPGSATIDNAMATSCAEMIVGSKT